MSCYNDDAANIVSLIWHSTKDNINKQLEVLDIQYRFETEFYLYARCGCRNFFIDILLFF